MKIIDAHLHLFPSEPGTDAMAAEVGHVNSVDHLRQVYGTLGMVHGVVMGNRSLEVGFHHYPRDLFHYCVGLDSLVLGRGETIPEDLPDQVEEHLKREECCGIKLYPGYNKSWLTAPIYEPLYQLAQKYDKPVAVHMGLTAGPRAHLKYSHPLVLDEAAADHRRTQFVMCHFGNPFLQEAAGRVDLDMYFQERAGYAQLLRTWLSYVGCWDRVMYGTDWPIVNLGEYIQYIQRIVPEPHWEKVFFENANRIYRLGL